MARLGCCSVPPPGEAEGRATARLELQPLPPLIVPPHFATHSASGPQTVSAHIIDRLIFHHQIAISYRGAGSEGTSVLRGE